MDRRSRTAGLLIIAGGVFHATWMLQFVLGSPLSPWTSYASELAAQGQPHAWVYRRGDLLSGSLLVAAGLVVRRHGSGRAHRWLCAMVVLFGAATVLDSFCPMSCVATADPACAAREAAGQVPWRHKVHTWTSATAGGAFWVALALALRRPGRSVLSWLLVLLGVAWSLATVWTLVQQVPGWPAHLLGLAQRLELLLTTAWLLVVGIGWWRHHHPTVRFTGAGVRRRG